MKERAATYLFTQPLSDSGFFQKCALTSAVTPYWYYSALTSESTRGAACDVAVQETVKAIISELMGIEYICQVVYTCLHILTM